MLVSFKGRIQKVSVAGIVCHLSRRLRASFSDPHLLAGHHGVLLWPLGDVTLEGYQQILENKSMLIGFKNTLLYVGLGTFINMVMTIMGAFTLSRRNLMLKNGIMVLITITMYFGGGLIPWYLLMHKIGLYNNLPAMVIPTALNTWNMIVMRSGFQSLPYELEEAARIDGASQARLLLDVILPLSKPILAVVLLYYFVGNWNNWFNAMVLLKDRDMYPLQLILKEILIQNNSAIASAGSAEGITAYRELMKYSGIVVSTLPLLVLYPFLETYFVQGVFVGSIKG